LTTRLAMTTSLIGLKASIAYAAAPVKPLLR
jgi:hypothetical protein